MWFMAAFWTGYLLLALTDFGSLPDFNRQDAGGDRNDGIAREHGNGSQHFSHNCRRGDITISHRGDGDDGPVDALRNGGKSVLFPFHQVHDGSQDQHQGQYGSEEYDNLMNTELEGTYQHGSFLDIPSQFEYPEHPEQSEGPEGKQEGGLVKDQSQIGGKYGQQIYDPVETGDVLPGIPGGINPQHIFYAENNGEEPFGGYKCVVVCIPECADGFQQHHGDA